MLHTFKPNSVIKLDKFLLTSYNIIGTYFVINLSSIIQCSIMFI